MGKINAMKTERLIIAKTKMRAGRVSWVKYLQSVKKEKKRLLMTRDNHASIK